MKLKPGEIICDKCKGIGHFGYSVDIKEYSDYAGNVVQVPGQKNYNYCDKCGGDGKLDWIEAVVGKRETRLKPGVYMKEVDYSLVIPTGSDIEWEII